MSLYGSGSDVPACGLGFGDCVIMELLREKGLLPNLAQQTDFVVVPFDDTMRFPALRVTRTLRSAGYSVDLLLEPTRKVKLAFSYADRVGGNRVVFVAPDEWEQGLVRIKHLRVEGSVRAERAALAPAALPHPRVSPAGHSRARAPRREPRWTCPSTSSWTWYKRWISGRRRL